MRGINRFAQLTHAFLFCDLRRKTLRCTPRYCTRMKRLFALLLFATTAFAADEPTKLAITLEPLGDNDAGVVSRLTFKYEIPSGVPEGVPLVIVGSTTQGQSVKTFRYPVQPSQRTSMTAIQTLQPGDVDVEARLMIPPEEEKPVIVAKNELHFTVAKTNKPFTASESDGAEAIVAEGSVPATGDAVHIAEVKRDVAPNLFIVNVDTKDPVKRVEFWVEG